MRSTILRSAAFFSFVVLTGLGGAYVVSTKANALDLSALLRASSAVKVSGESAAADRPIVREDLRKMARQAMNDLIASGKHSQN
jgi:hypothetical protein